MPLPRETAALAAFSLLSFAACGADGDDAVSSAEAVAVVMRIAGDTPWIGGEREEIVAALPEGVEWLEASTQELKEADVLADPEENLDVIYTSCEAPPTWRPPAPTRWRESRWPGTASASTWRRPPRPRATVGKVSRDS